MQAGDTTRSARVLRRGTGDRGQRSLNVPKPISIGLNLRIPGFEPRGERFQPGEGGTTRSECSPGRHHQSTTLRPNPKPRPSILNPDLYESLCDPIIDYKHNCSD